MTISHVLGRYIDDIISLLCGMQQWLNEAEILPTHKHIHVLHLRQVALHLLGWTQMLTLLIR